MLALHAECELPYSICLLRWGKPCLSSGMLWSGWTLQLSNPPFTYRAFNTTSILPPLSLPQDDSKHHENTWSLHQKRTTQFSPKVIQHAPSYKKLVTENDRRERMLAISDPDQYIYPVDLESCLGSYTSWNLINRQSCYTLSTVVTRGSSGT